MIMLPISNCVFCKHNKCEKKDGWKATCDAFPEGFPPDFDDCFDTESILKCNGEIGFELSPDKEAMFNRILKKRS